MTKNPTKKLIYDYAFLYYLQQKKITTQLFIDSRDVIKMLFGLREVLNYGGGLNKAKYDSVAVSVHSLIYGKWLGQFKLLTPHQDELYFNLTNDTIFPRQGNIEHKESFWKSVDAIIGLNEKDFEKKLPLDEYLKKLEPKSQELYKANYFLRETDWRRRLKHMHDNGIIGYDPEDYDYKEFIGTPLFKKIFKAFESIRDRHTKKNVADTLVLCCMHKKLVEYKSSKNKGKLPIFYDEHGLFLSVLDKSGMIKEFSIKFPDNSFEFCIICQEYFLQLNALILNRKKIKNMLDDKAYADFLDFQKNSIQIIENYGLGARFERESTQVIKKFISSRFLQVCWVTNKEETIAKVIEMLIGAKKQNLRSRESSQLLENFTAENIDKIKQNIRKFLLFKETFVAISQAKTSIRSQFTNNLYQYQNQDIDLDVFNLLSLTRFSFYTEICKDIQKYSIALLIEDNKNNEDIIITEIIGFVEEGVEKNDHEKLGVALAILWILSEFKLIIRILSLLNHNYKHYSEAFLHAASIVKLPGNKVDIREVRKILSIVNNWAPKYAFYNNYKTAIAASYVYYYMWERNTVKNFFTTLEIPSKIVKNKNEADSYFLEAIDLATFAIKKLETNNFYNNAKKPYRKSKYYYILNNYIYYVTIGSDNKPFSQLKDKVDVLASIEETEYWQYRYSDTLALYNLRLARMHLQKRQQSQFDLYIDEAVRYNKSALKGVLSNDDRKHYERLTIKIKKIKNAGEVVFGTKRTGGGQDYRDFAH